MKFIFEIALKLVKMMIIYLHVLYRDKDELMLLVHHLYLCFPDNVMFIPNNSKEHGDVKTNAIHCLKEELKLLVTSIKKVKGQNIDPCSEELKNERTEKGDANVDNVRSNLVERKRSLKKRDEQFVPLANSQIVKSELRNLQQHTDNAMSLLTDL